MPRRVHVFVFFLVTSFLLLAPSSLAQSPTERLPIEALMRDLQIRYQW